jgi:hypothetical protein
MTQKVRWGAYREYSGPWFRGVIPYKRPKNPMECHNIAAVVTATEGGHLDSINRYDRCIDTQGLTQFCNRYSQRSVDKMYALIDRIDPDLIRPVTSIVAQRGYSFKDGHFHHTMGPLDSPAKQAQMYFLGCSGKRGEWTDEGKNYAMKLVAAAAKVWENPLCQKVQLEYTLRNLQSFVFGKDVQALMKEALAVNSDISMAFRAAHISFAVNNPKKAMEAMRNTMAQTKALKWTKSWLLSALYHLTFDAGFAIYPHRYNAIRKPLERIYGIDLPDFADEIRDFGKQFPPQFMDPTEIQRALLILGYDLGPKGADGVFGAKSKDALRAFELDAGVPPQAVDGVLDPWTLEALEKSLEEKGLEELGG